MNLIHIFLILSVLMFPAISFLLYLTHLERRAKKIIRLYSDSSSEIFTDLNVWVKNFDVFKKKNKFDLDRYETLYSFNYCEMIVNEKNIVVIGTTRILGRNKLLTPSIFEFENIGLSTTPGHVEIKNVGEYGNDLEIEFADPRYTNTMTLVIKKWRKRK